MKTTPLYRRICFIAGLTVFALSECQAQLSDFADREKLKGYSLVTCQIMNSGFKTIYFLNRSGDIIKTEHYEDDQLTGLEAFTYSRNGLMKSRTAIHEVHTFNGRSYKDTTYMDFDHFTAYTYHYKRKRLVKEIAESVDSVFRNLNYIRSNYYDNEGRLIREVFADYTMGLELKFASNSTVLDTAYQKKTITQRITTHTPHDKKVISITRDEDGNILNMELTTLNGEGKPILTKQKDAEGRDLVLTSYEYDQQGRLKRKKIELPNLELITFDFSNVDELEFRYNTRSLPIKIISKSEGNIVSESVFNYR